MAVSGLIGILGEVLGAAGARKILEAKGGQDIYVPRPEKLAPGHWLAALLGREAALAFCARFQREKLSLPLGRAAGARNALHRRVIEMSLEGKSVNQIAGATGLHARSVRRLRTRYLG